MTITRGRTGGCQGLWIKISEVDHYSWHLSTTPRRTGERLRMAAVLFYLGFKGPVCKEVDIWVLFPSNTEA